MKSGTEIKPITRKGRLGEGMAWCIAGLTWALSFASQVGLALQHGFHGWEQWEAIAMALVSDLGAQAMMFLSLDQAERGRSAKLTWGIAIACAAMMEWSNIAFALPDPVAVVLHAWAPLLTVATVFVLVHIRRTNAIPASAQVIDQGPQPEPPSPRLDPLPDRSQERALPESGSAPEREPELLPVDEVLERSRKRSQARAGARVKSAPKRTSREERLDQVRALLAEPGGHALTGEEIGARLRVDAGYARKLKSEVLADDTGRRPRLLEAHEAEPASAAGGDR